MGLELLNRADSPFSEQLWKYLDETVKTIATQELSVRKLLHIEGPYGLGFKTLDLNDRVVKEESSGELTVTSSMSVPLAMLSIPFTLAARDIDQFTSTRVPFSVEPIFFAVKFIADKEDQILLLGSKNTGLPGLTNAPGVQHLKLSAWNQVGDAVEAIITAIDKLDLAGFHGPYALALAPALYNKLFRRYPQADILEFDHLSTIVTDTIVKAPGLQSGGILIAAGQQFASIAVGQDLTTGFEGPVGRNYNFILSESIALRLNVPGAVCVLDS